MKTKNIYALPVKDYEKTISDPRAHPGHLKHAIDFIVPEGTEVLAALDGEVIVIKQDSEKGGSDLKYVKDANFVTIKHANNELSEYIHLKKGSVKVKEGDKVKEGQVLALTGLTGFLTQPHLHFHVCILTDTEEGYETLELK